MQTARSYHRQGSLRIALLAMALLPFAGATAQATEDTADDSASQRQTATPDAQLPSDLVAWLAQQSSADDALLAEVRNAYSRSSQDGRSSPDGAAVANLAQLLATAGPAIETTVSSVANASSGDETAVSGLMAPGDWLSDKSIPPSVRGNVALAVAGELHARRYYEEALAWLDGVSPTDVIAPHLLHYYRAVARHQLVRLEPARESAEQLLKLSDRAARRHIEAARLVLRDAKGVEPDSLNHVARTMNDIRRRFDLGRGDEPEKALQQQVLDALDKKIEDAEKQQQQQQQQAAAGNSPAAPSQAAEESRPMELKGPGETDRRELAAGDDWGSLSPHERERVTQQISRDFPAYYREVIEAYFRSLAQDADVPPNQRDSARDTPAKEAPR